MVKYKNDYEFFHNRLKKLKLTNKEFADFLDISNTSLTKWKNKNRVPTYALVALKYIEIIKYNADFIREIDILCKK